MVPLYCQNPDEWTQLMRTTLAFNGSYFNTNRMVKQYTRNAYYPVKLVENAAKRNRTTLRCKWQRPENCKNRWEYAT